MLFRSNGSLSESALSASFGAICRYHGVLKMAQREQVLGQPSAVTAHVLTTAVAQQATVQIGVHRAQRQTNAHRRRGVAAAVVRLWTSASAKRPKPPDQVEPEAPIELVELNDPILLGCVIGAPLATEPELERR